MFDPKNPKLSDVDMNTSEFIGNGAYGQVYRVYPGFVMKIGDVDIREVEQQEYLYSHGLALPVLDYAENAILTYEANSIGEVPEGKEDAFSDFMDWIEQEWFTFGLSHLDNHEGNWGTWINPTTGEEEFIWIDCDPDWDCDKCDICRRAVNDCEAVYLETEHALYCPECAENLPRCEECNDVLKEDNKTGLCDECTPDCEACGKKLALDSDDYWYCPDCDNKKVCACCGTKLEPNSNNPQCDICRKIQPFLPGLGMNQILLGELTV